jgi:hypothetical protein
VPPLVVHNVMVIAAFATAGLAAAHLTRYFAPSPSAQVIAGLIFAFAPYRVAHLAHLELLWTAFIPLALLALYRVLEQPTSRRAVWFGACVGMQALCSIYYGVFLTLWLVPALLLAPLVVKVRWSRRLVAAALVSVATAAVLVSPYAAPYRAAHRALGPRPVSEVVTFSARLSDYWQPSPHNRVYSARPRLEQDERSLFVGAVALVLVVLGLATVRSRAVWMWAALTLIALDLSLGVNGLVFPLVGRVAPMLDGLRAPARFGVFVLLGVAVLAGLALAHALARLSSPRLRATTAALIGTLLVAEYWAAPITTYEVPIRPAGAHAWLAAQPPTVVATLPMPPANELWGYETVFQYLSIFHWQRMVNGYSGHAPESYYSLAHQVQDFPSDQAVGALRARGVEHVLFHERYTEKDQFNQFLYACSNPVWFSEVHTFRDFRIGRSAVCRIAPSGPPPLR